MAVSRQLRSFLIAAGLVAALAVAAYGVVLLGAAADQAGGTDAAAAEGGRSDGWRGVRSGAPGRVSLPDPQAGVLIQSEGEIWRSLRNGPVTAVGAWAMFGMLVALTLFYAWRGRIPLAGPPAGSELVRFNGTERFAHWLTAGSFVVLALTGLNLLYGRYLLIPILGKEAFAVMTEAGKILHNFVAAPFVAGLVLLFALWVRHNLPSRVDGAWLRAGGGLLSDRHHPPAERFNAGQKVIFWVVILGGFSVSLSGLSLLLPFGIPLFGKTFAMLNLLGFGLPEALTPMQEMQLAHLWHSIVSLGLIVVILAHIYIGTIGMEGAFQAMGSGKVDRAWARQHHSLWAEAPHEGEQDVRPAAAAKEPG